MRWPAARCCRCCRRARSSPTRSASSPRPWAPTAPPRWARSAPRRCRCSRPVSRCKAAVAGIAMGLISGEVDGETEYVALTDILGAEDAFGDMDFKVAGTREFVTALQLDTKLDGIPAEVLAVGADPGQGRPAGDPRRDGRGDRRSRGDVALRPADHHGPGAGRQDRRGHRPQGQDHQPDPGRHRRDAVDRGRRHGLHRCDQRRGGRGRQGRRQRDRQPDHARGRRALPRHGREDDQLRRVRLADAGQGRPAPHQQAARPRRRQARRRRRGRRVRRPEDPGPDRRDRRPRQAVAGPGRRGRAAPPTRRARTSPSDLTLHTDDRPAAQRCWPVVR